LRIFEKQREERKLDDRDDRDDNALKPSGKKDVFMCARM